MGTEPYFLDFLERVGGDLWEIGLRPRCISQCGRPRVPFRVRKTTFRGRGLTTGGRAAGPKRRLELTYKGRGG